MNHSVETRHIQSGPQASVGSKTRSAARSFIIIRSFLFQHIECCQDDIAEISRYWFFFSALLKIMIRSLRLLSALSLIVFCCFSVSVAPQTQQAKITISTPEQIAEDFKAIPCKNEERLEAVKALFKKLGATESDLITEKHKNVENLVVTLPGASEERIVVGAHYDKAADGCGAIDNWTGIVALAHLYKTLKDLSLKKTVLFVAFDKEERGMVGSQAMVKQISKDQAGQYCAMVNLDSLGMGAPQVAHNLSSRKLETLAANLAKEMELPFGNAEVPGISDSESFRQANIPAMTIHGLAGDWMRTIHHSTDQVKKVNTLSVYLCYRLALAVVVRIERNDCQEWRETKQK
jgi:hypothetical protein